MKFIAGLRQKKKRQQKGLFVAEGEKLVAHLQNLLGSPEYAFYTQEKLFEKAQEITEIEMARLSSLIHPSPILAVFKQPSFSDVPFKNAFTLILDGIRDPGNLGTIIRLCDWFGVSQIICTDDCVDVFNEKVVQASMGSVASIPVISLHREAILSAVNNAEVSLVGTQMDAPSVYSSEITSKCALVIGNEGQGISPILSAACNQFISIPAAPQSQAESLNAAVSAAVILAEFSRRKLF